MQRRSGPGVVAFLGTEIVDMGSTHRLDAVDIEVERTGGVRLPFPIGLLEEAVGGHERLEVRHPSTSRAEGLADSIWHAAD